MVEHSGGGNDGIRASDNRPDPAGPLEYHGRPATEYPTRMRIIRARRTVERLIIGYYEESKIERKESPRAGVELGPQHLSAGILLPSQVAAHTNLVYNKVLNKVRLV